MIRVEEISASGLKNLRSLRLELGPLVGLTGPNGAGKTAILQAVRLAVLGYEPSVGKTLAATRSLCAGGPAAVGLRFSDGFTIARAFGDSIATNVMPLRGETTERQRQARIEAETGVFLPSFDLEAFLTLSAEKRREMLFGLLPREAIGLTIESWREWLGYARAEPTVQAAIDKLWREQIERAPSPLDGLGAALSYVHDRVLAAERERKTQEVVAEDASAAALREAEAAARFDPAALERMQDDLTGVNIQLGRARRRAEEIDEAQRKHRQRVHDIAAVKIQIGDSEAAIEKARHRLEYVRTRPRPDLNQLEQHAREAEAELARMPRPAAEALEAARAAVVEAEAALRARQLEAKQARDRAQEVRIAAAPARQNLRDLEDASACPVCGAVESLEAVRARLRTEVEAAVVLLRALEAEEQAAAAREREATAALNGAIHAQRQIEKEVQAHDDFAERARNLRTRVQELEAKREAEEAEAAEWLAKAEAALEQARAERDRLAALDAPPPVEDVTAEIDALEARAAELGRGIRELQDLAKRAGRAEAAQQRADEERRELERRRGKAEALAGIHAALQRLRAHAIQSLVGPVEATANRILQEIDPGKTFRFVFEGAGARPMFDFGFEEGGQFRSFGAASTGEEAFLAVVLVAALVAAVKPAWRVLMIDNAESIDPVRRTALLEALARVAGEYFDNVFVAGCCEFPDVDGWQVVDVAELTGAAGAAAV